MFVEFQSAISISDMAKQVGLSRQRFHQLVGEGVFPHPLYDIRSRRPFYPEDFQAVCKEVRRRNFGINGRPILFYARRPTPIGSPEPRAAKSVTRMRKPVPAKAPIAEIGRFVEGLKGLGLTTVTDAAVMSALQTLYRQGWKGVDQSEVLRNLFVHLMRRT